MIGKTLSEILLAKGFTVIGTDSTTNNLINAPNYTFCQSSIDDKGAISGIFASSKIDMLIHLACSVDNDFPATLTSNEEKICANTDKYLYKTAVDAGVKDILLLSTHLVYAVAKTREPIRETMDEKPTSSYGKMKMDSEKALTKAASKGDSKVIIARVCPIYTKGYADNLQSKVYDPKDGCAFIFGTGDYSYSLCCMFNFIDFVIGLLNIGPGINYPGIYNICDTKPLMAKDIIEFLREFHKLGPVVQKNYGSDSFKGAFGGKDAKNYYRFNDLSIACSNISYDNTKAQRISTFRWKLGNTR